MAGEQNASISSASPRPIGNIATIPREERHIHGGKNTKLKPSPKSHHQKCTLITLVYCHDLFPPPPLSSPLRRRRRESGGRRKVYHRRADVVVQHTSGRSAGKGPQGGNGPAMPLRRAREDIVHKRVARGRGRPRRGRSLATAHRRAVPAVAVAVGVGGVERGRYALHSLVVRKLLPHPVRRQD